MARDIDPQIAQELQENHRQIIFVKINFDTTLLAHSRYGEMTLNSETYYGVGQFGNISTKTEDAQTNPTRLTLTLSGIPLNYIELVTEGNYQNRDVYIYKGLLSDSETLIGSTAINWFRGVTGNASIQEDAGGNVQIELEVANWLSKWRRPSNIRYNDKQQQELYAGDTCMQYLTQAQRGKAWRGV
jgi:hypothetical protein